MNINIPYDFICLLAFKSKLKFGNDRYISFEEIIKYANTIISNAIKDYSLIDDKYVKVSCKFNEEAIEELNDNYYFFEIDENGIYLDDDITYEEMSEYYINKLTEISNNRTSSIILSIIDSLQDIFVNKDALRDINADDMYSIYESLIGQELKLEKSYYNNSTEPSKDNFNKLKRNMFLRYLALNNIKCIPDYRREALFNIAYSSCEEADLTYDENDLPFDCELYSESPYINFEDIDSIIEKIDSIEQLAIFGSYPLYYKKMLNELIRCENSINNTKINKDNAEIPFYLKYTENSLEFLNTHEDDDLKSSIYRLKYALDNDELCLFNKTNIDIVSNTDYSYFKNEAKYFIDDLFLEDRIFMVSKKLMFIKTYYDLTLDNEIVNIFDKYSSYENYDLYKKVIFNKNKELKKNFKDN